MMKRARMLCRGAMLLGTLAALGDPGRAWAVEPEVAPFLGMGEPTGEGSDGYDLGLVLGLSVGARVSPLLSLQGQVEYDRLNIDSPLVRDGAGWVGRLVLSPAFHLVLDQIDLSVAPMFGLFRVSISATAGNLETSFTVRGFDLGGRATMLIAVSPTVAVGPQLSYVRMFASKTCSKAGSAELCDGDPNNEDEGFWSLAVAARF